MDGRRTVVNRRDIIRGGGALAAAWLWVGCWESDQSGGTGTAIPVGSTGGGDNGAANDAGSGNDAADGGIGEVVDADGALDASAGGDSGRPVASEAQVDGRIPILWVETGICTGCAVSLLNEDGVEKQLPDLRFEFQETMMDGYGDKGVDDVLKMMDQYAHRYILFVDGAIPTGSRARMTVLAIDRAEKEWTAEDFVVQAAARARSVVAVGTCAAWGGIPAARPNPGSHRSVPDVLASHGLSPETLVRIPGCPPRSDWMVELLLGLLKNDPPDLDSLGRPLKHFGKTIHDLCPRKALHDQKKFADQPGDESQCLRHVGCKGPICHADCVSLPYVNGAHCIMANHPCIGCAAPGFPDAQPIGTETMATSPFYTRLPDGI